MIYGLNFTSEPIPPGVARKFAKRIRLAPRKYATLDGVAQSPEERDAMLEQGSNGHRTFTVVEKQTAGGVWFGLYVS